MIEIWKSIPRFEERYQASSLGRIRSLDMVVGARGGFGAVRKGRILVQSEAVNGYLKVSLTKMGQRAQQFFVHIIVCETFHGSKITDDEEVRHLDGNQKNNKEDNLCWGDRFSNYGDCERHGTASRGRIKLTETQVIDIRLEYAPQYADEMAKRYGISKGHLVSVATNRFWKRV